MVALATPFMLRIAALALHIALSMIIPDMDASLVRVFLMLYMTKGEPCWTFIGVHMLCSIAFAAVVRPFSLILYSNSESYLPLNGA